MKTVAIFNPYWDSLGGGEKYIATIALAFLKLKYIPTIIWHDQTLLTKIQDRFGIDLTDTKIDSTIYKNVTGGSTLSRFKMLSKFDTTFWLSDGSIPFLNSTENLLHFQVPFVQKPSILNQIKISRIQHVICNSNFTKNIIDASYKCNSQVLYPPVTLIPSAKKEKIILSVGRFDNILHSKRQDILIEAFKQLNISGWKLILAGGSLNSSKQEESLKKFVGNSNIELVINPSFNEIKKLYGKAKIYWHATGFGSNLKNNPEKAEHFGISTVEAMSAGAIPIVFAGGGQLEIVQDGVNGYLWETVSQLVNITQNVVYEYNHLNKINQSAIDTAEKFSQEKFIHEFIKIIR